MRKIIKKHISCPKHGTVEIDMFENFITSTSPEEICPYCELEKQKELLDQTMRLSELKKMGLYEEHYNASLENFYPPTDKANRHLSKIKEFAKNPGRKCLVLYGNNGTGKSKLLSALVKKLGGKYTTYEWLSLKIKSTYSPKAEYSEKDIFKELCTIPFLAIDEIEKGSEDKRSSRLSFIIRERYERKKPLALAGNFTWEWLKKIFDGSIINRWQCAGQSFEFDWDSYRFKE